jgi:hypothetical protein
MHRCRYLLQVSTMTEFQFIRMEYLLARRQHGWLQSLRSALAANQQPLPF